MLILGIDPGSINCGYGIIETEVGKITLAGCNTIKTKSKNILSKRLLVIYDELINIITLYKPDVAAIESMFYGKNIQSAFTLGHARGVCLLALAANKIDFFEYSPREIKKSITGNGNSTKEQIQYMIRNIFPTKGIKQASFDATDALAVAYCHYNKIRFLQKLKQGE